MMPRLGPEKGWMLRVFGAHVDQAFGHIPYHVGSSLTADTWRDVDVRLILPDDEYAALFVAAEPVDVPRERVLMWNLAWSAFGAHMTRLPIDFQFQSQTLANAEYSGPRGALLLLDRELPVARSVPPVPDDQKERGA